jgi:hypothetical protein
MKLADIDDAQRWSSAAAREERSDEWDVGCNDLLYVGAAQRYGLSQPILLGKARRAKRTCCPAPAHVPRAL